MSYALYSDLPFVTLFLLVAMAVKIGVDLAAIFEVEICRLHGRYYNFVFPGLVLLFLTGDASRSLAALLSSPLSRR